MSFDECVRLGASESKQVQQESKVDVELRGNVEGGKFLFGIDGMDQCAHVLCSIEVSAIDQILNELDHAHLAHEARIEGQRGGVIEDCTRGSRNLWNIDRIDLYD